MVFVFVFLLFIDFNIVLGFKLDFGSVFLYRGLVFMLVIVGFKKNRVYIVGFLLL